MYKDTNSKLKSLIIKPIYNPKKNLTLLQKRLMKEHQKYHTKRHLQEMNKLMKKGYCFQQAHDITIKKIGK